MKLNNFGFTLIELLVVIAICGIILSIIIPIFTNIGQIKIITVYLKDGKIETFNPAEFNGKTVYAEETKTGGLHLFTRDKKIDIHYSLGMWERYTTNNIKAEHE